MYERQQLIDLCEKAVVSQSKWSNRDSASAQIKVGTVWALLKAGCDFRVITADSLLPDEDGICVTDDWTIWLEIKWQGFGYHENIADDDDDEEKEAALSRETFYLPTPARLKACQGQDWY